jgi:co-chaperonin GroES (HSP10)
MPTLQPLGNKIVIRPDQPKKETASGIILPQKTLSKEVPKQGIVVSIGPEVGVKSIKARNEALSELKKSSPSEEWSALDVLFAKATIVKTGDRVLFNAFAGSDIEIGEGPDAEKFTVMLEDDILAILIPSPPAKDEFASAAETVGKRKGK